MGVAEICLGSCLLFAFDESEDSKIIGRDLSNKFHFQMSLKKYFLVTVVVALGLLYNGPGDRLFFLFPLLLGSVYTDVCWRWLPNRLLFAAILLGLFVNTLRPEGITFSITGLVLGFGVMLALYLFGAVAAGDIKLAAAVGAMTGPWFTIGMLGWSILLSSAVGIVFMIYKGRLAEMLSFTVQYSKYLIYKILRRDYTKEPLAKADIDFPFAVFVTLGCLMELLYPGVMFGWLESLLKLLKESEALFLPSWR